MTQQLKTCGRCGAAVVDTAAHRAWHAALVRERSESVLTHDQVEHLEERLLELEAPLPGLARGR